MTARENRPKVALIGPALPYRSGIAIHTSKLRDALAEFTEVEVVSFKRQYPQWLYPGKDKPPDLKTQAASGVRYIIDVYNPLSWRKAADEVVASGCDVAILTWWTLFWQPGFVYMLRRLKKRGVKTIYFCHNLFNHKTGGIMGLADRLLFGASKAMLKQADAYIVQSREQEKELLEIKPHAVFMRRMHPVAGDTLPPSETWPKRGKLEVLFFGLIRPYKGLDLLLEAAEQLQDKDIYWSVVGELWGDATAIQQKLQAVRIPNLETNLEYVSDQVAANYFARADVVALPYRAATGSAVVALAYAYGKPVLATAVSGLVDAVLEGETGWLVKPNSATDLAETLKKVTRQEAAAMKPAIDKFRYENSWPAMGQAVADFVRKLTS